VLYLVRHGESEWNVRQRLQGQTAHPRLTARGKEQAAAAAEAIAADLAGRPTGSLTVHSSDLRRAIQTAEIIGARLGVGVQPDIRLREQHVGDLQGMPSAVAASRLDDIDWSDPDVPFGGGESTRQVYDRMAQALAGRHQSSTESTVVVSHGDAIRLALGGLGGFGAADSPWPTIGNASVFAISPDGSARAL
jgi:probable phosphoglycerate mutase